MTDDSLGFDCLRCSRGHRDLLAAAGPRNAPAAICIWCRLCSDCHGRAYCCAPDRHGLLGWVCGTCSKCLEREWGRAMCGRCDGCAPCCACAGPGARPAPPFVGGLGGPCSGCNAPAEEFCGACRRCEACTGGPGCPRCGTCEGCEVAAGRAHCPSCRACAACAERGRARRGQMPGSVVYCRDCGAEDKRDFCSGCGAAGPRSAEGWSCHLCKRCGPCAGGPPPVPGVRGLRGLPGRVPGRRLRLPLRAGVAAALFVGRPRRLRLRLRAGVAGGGRAFCGAAAAPRRKKGPPGAPRAGAAAQTRSPRTRSTEAVLARTKASLTTVRLKRDPIRGVAPRSWGAAIP